MVCVYCGLKYKESRWYWNILISILIISEFLTGNISTCLTIWSDKWHKLHWWLIPEPISCLLNKLLKKVSSFLKVFYYLESDILIKMIYTDLIFFQSLGSCSQTNITISFLLCFIIWTGIYLQNKILIIKHSK